MKKIQTFGGILLLLTMTMVGCNIFNFSAPDDADTYNSDGLEALQDGDYEKAIEEYLKAIEEDPNNADAHWGLAKAYIRQTGYTSISIMTELSTFQTSGSFLPFMDEPIEQINGLYEGVISANEHMGKIFSGQAVNEELYDMSIALDYTGTLALQGILLLRDTNVSGHIGDGDLVLDPQFDINGDFSMDNDWFNLSEDQQDSLFAMLEDLLINSGDVLTLFVNSFLFDENGDSLDFSSGFDTENLDVVIDAILEGFIDFTDMGGPGPDSAIRPSDLHDFVNGGQK